MRRSLGRAWRVIRPVVPGLAYHARARRILRRYAAHYAEARARYRTSRDDVRPAIDSIRHLGVRVVRPGDPGPAIALPADFAGLAATVGAAAARALDDPDRCVFVPPLAATPAPGLPASRVPEVERGDVLMIQAADPLELPGLDALCEPLVDEIERRLFGCHVLVEKLYVYRTPVGRPAVQGSWLWHFDNHPPEIAKAMVYLTDVTGETGPFEYLRQRSTGEAVPGAPVTPLYGSSRVPPAAIEKRLREGAEPCAVTGAAGTVIVFDNNVVHRATVARRAHRDVLVLQLRPALSRVRPRLDPAWTGSFRHAPFAADPRRLTPSLRRLRHFS